MDGNKPMRIDKFLWSVRLYKTRSLASEACRAGKIIINEVEAKPSRTVLKGDTLVIKKTPVVFTYRVTGLVESRVAADVARQCLEDLTAPEELAKLDIRRSAGPGFREKGLGRPTKKDRREIERLKEPDSL